MRFNFLLRLYFAFSAGLLIFYKAGILRHSLTVVSLVSALCGLSLYYSVNNLGFNTDTAEMLSPELPFHQNRIHFWESFPQDVKTLLIVVDAFTPETSKKVAERLGKQLNKEKNVIETVYIPGEGAFFDERALLYLDADAIVRISDTLTDIQPLLGQLALNNSLGEFLDLIGKAVTDQKGLSSLDLNPLLKKIEEAFGDAETGDFKEVSWQTLLTGKDTILNRTRRYVIVKAKLDFTKIFPAQQAIEVVKNHAKTIESENDGVTIRMTGETTLQHEELESVSQGSAISAVVSFILVGVTLFVGLRSARLISAAILTLISGLLLTSGFATLAIGHLNMISIAFAVLYIGLGVDYAIHFCLHYQKFLNQGKSTDEALIAGVRSIAPAIALCAITSATGFYSFIPTSYSGVSELGVISGTSMFIGLFLTLTFLPALLHLLKAGPMQQKVADSPRKKQGLSTASTIQRDRMIRWSALAFALISVITLPYVTFDFDPVHLRDQRSESVKTYNDLVQDPDSSPLTLSILESDRDQMLDIADKVKQLSTVKKVLTIENFIPENQSAKLELIDEMNLVLGPLPHPFPGLSENNDQKKAFLDFQNAVNKAIEIHRGTGLERELITLRDRFTHFNNSEKLRGSELRVLKLFERNLLTSLPATVNMLQSALKAKAFQSDQLPKDLKERWVSSEGIYRIQVYPNQDITQLENLRAFVEDVQTIAPHATDLPVIYYEAGREVVKAFQQALVIALLAITLVLLLVLKSIRDALFVLMPLILAAMLTGATSVLIGLPFNFANIIAVPLLLGLGVDSGIHIMHSIRMGIYSKKLGLMRNITSRGILFSSLTTVFSFSSLAFSSHTGTASMGILLAIGIFFTLLCTLIVMPTFVLPAKR